VTWCIFWLGCSVLMHEMITHGPARNYFLQSLASQSSIYCLLARRNILAIGQFMVLWRRYGRGPEPPHS
jgi:hypothetical protein